MTMFYRFRQNNSGGYYKDPARNLFIAAPSAEVAKIAAQTFAVYFDGWTAIAAATAGIRSRMQCAPRIWRTSLRV